MINKREVQESIDSYLGDSEKQTLKTIDKKTLSLFLSKKIKMNTSYFVYGTELLLKQFKSFYLVSSTKEVNRLKYGTYMISEYARILTQYDNTDDIGTEEILFLYSHKNDIDLGNSELWLAKTIINEIANRNRKGYITIILSERPITLIEKSGEVEIINLNSKYQQETKNHAIKKAQEVSTEQSFY